MEGEMDPVQAKAAVAPIGGAIFLANGDLSKKITVDVRGEILQLKETINTMLGLRLTQRRRSTPQKPAGSRFPNARLLRETHPRTTSKLYAKPGCKFAFPCLLPLDNCEQVIG
jgi:hypothetical protein